jgi:ABC-type nitrate/sulfonate/bicarbonate transport system permease component
VKRGELGAFLRMAAAEIPPARGLVPLLALLTLWQLLAPGPSAYFPAPFEWWSAAVLLWGSGQLLPAFAATVTTFLEGLVLAVAIGVALGITIGTSRPVERALGPLLEFMRAIPAPVTVPIATLLLGYDVTMKLTVVALSAIWPILLNTSSAAAHVEPLLRDVARTFRPTARWVRQVIIHRLSVYSAEYALRFRWQSSSPLVRMLTSLPGIGALMIQSQRNFNAGLCALVVVGCSGSSSTICSLSSKRSCCGDGRPGVCFDLVELKMTQFSRSCPALARVRYDVIPPHIGGAPLVLERRTCKSRPISISKAPAKAR